MDVGKESKTVESCTFSKPVEFDGIKIPVNARFHESIAILSSLFQEFCCCLKMHFCTER
jgi:hypothetical protein